MSKGKQINQPHLLLYRVLLEATILTALYRGETPIEHDSHPGVMNQILEFKLLEYLVFLKQCNEGKKDVQRRSCE